MDSYWNLQAAASAAEIAKDIEALREHVELNLPSVRRLEEFILECKKKLCLCQQDTLKNIEVFLEFADEINTRNLRVGDPLKIIPVVFAGASMPGSPGSYGRSLLLIYFMLFDVLSDPGPDAAGGQKFDTYYAWIMIAGIYSNRNDRLPKRLTDTGETREALQCAIEGDRVSQVLLSQAITLGDRDKLEDRNTFSESLQLAPPLEWFKVNSRIGLNLSMALAQVFTAPAHLERVDDRMEEIIKNGDIFSETFLKYCGSVNVDFLAEVLLFKLADLLGLGDSKREIAQMLRRSTSFPPQNLDPDMPSKPSGPHVQESKHPELTKENPLINPVASSALEGDVIELAIIKVEAMGLASRQMIDSSRSCIDESFKKRVHLYNHIGMRICSIDI